jgi:lysozyme
MRPTPQAWIAVALAAVAAAGALALGAAGLSRGWWSWNHPDRERFPVRGIDVSRHQGRIDWRRVAAEGGIRFAYLKATEGGDWTDPRFLQNWRAAREAGLRVGAYHFFTFCTPPEEQARHFLAVVPPDPGALPPALDLELGGNCKRVPSREELQAGLLAWSRLVEAGLGKRPVIYVTDDSWRAFLRGGGVDHPLWFRSLFGGPPGEAGPWLFWQFQHRGRLPGIDGFVDLDAFRGGAEELERL